MHEPGKSDGPVVPSKSAKIDYWELHRRWVERMEGRGPAKENAEGQAELVLPQAAPTPQVDRTQSRDGPGSTRAQDLSRAAERIRHTAGSLPG